MNSPSPIQLLVMQARKHHRYGMAAKIATHGAGEFGEFIRHEFTQRDQFMGAARTIHNYGINALHPKPVKRRFLLG